MVNEKQESKDWFQSLYLQAMQNIYIAAAG